MKIKHLAVLLLPLVLSACGGGGNPEPSTDPSVAPSVEPSVEPSENPSVTPSENPSEEPSLSPSEEPSENPSEEPSEEPSLSPSEEPSENPSEEPSVEPSITPSIEPSVEPSITPSIEPSQSLSEDIASDASSGGQSIAGSSSIDTPSIPEGSSGAQPSHISRSSSQYLELSSGYDSKVSSSEIPDDGKWCIDQSTWDDDIRNLGAFDTDQKTSFVGYIYNGLNYDRGTEFRINKGKYNMISYTKNQEYSGEEIIILDESSFKDPTGYEYDFYRKDGSNPWIHNEYGLGYGEVNLFDIMRVYLGFQFKDVTFSSLDYVYQNDIGKYLAEQEDLPELVQRFIESAEFIFRNSLLTQFRINFQSGFIARYYRSEEIDPVITTPSTFTSAFEGVINYSSVEETGEGAEKLETAYSNASIEFLDDNTFVLTSDKYVVGTTLYSEEVTIEGRYNRVGSHHYKLIPDKVETPSFIIPASSLGLEYDLFGNGKYEFQMTHPYGEETYHINLEIDYIG